jgi:hypothetical protein
MPTYTVAPPPPTLRKAFMDAVQDADIYIDRDRESFVVSVGPGQEEAWERIQREFSLEPGDEEPPVFLDF